MNSEKNSKFGERLSSSIDTERLIELCRRAGLSRKQTKHLLAQNIEPTNRTVKVSLSKEPYSVFSAKRKNFVNKKEFFEALTIGSHKMRLLRNSEKITKAGNGAVLYEYILPVPYLKKGSEMNLLHVSDTHFHKNSDKNAKLLRNLAKLVRREPDVVVLTGDIIEEIRADFTKAAESALLELFPDAKRLFVLGNHDYRNNSAKHVKTTLEKIGFEDLTDQFITAYAGRERVNFYGIGMVGFHDSKTPSLRGKEAQTNILVMHALDSLNASFPKEWDLALSGHLHAGELDLFLFDGVDVVFARGGYDNINEQKKGWLPLNKRTSSYISPGLATHAPFRFNTEKTGITLITLKGMR